VIFVKLIVDEVLVKLVVVVALLKKKKKRKKRTMEEQEPEEAVAQHWFSHKGNCWQLFGGGDDFECSMPFTLCI
jgi:hypothetical protein